MTYKMLCHVTWHHYSQALGANIYLWQCCLETCQLWKPKHVLVGLTCINNVLLISLSVNRKRTGVGADITLVQQWKFWALLHWDIQKNVNLFDKLLDRVSIWELCNPFIAIAKTWIASCIKLTVPAETAAITSSLGGGHCVDTGTSLWQICNTQGKAVRLWAL